MKIIQPSFQIEQCPTYQEALRIAEASARTCYKSEDKIDTGMEICPRCSLPETAGKLGCPVCKGVGGVYVREPSAVKLIRSCIKRGHESVIEHVAGISVRFICDRGVTHELVRHRLASYSMESTRYCNYAGDKFGNELTFIKPVFWNDDFVDSTERGICVKSQSPGQEWDLAMRDAERRYLRLLELGASPQEARSVLPNSLKTEIVMTANVREWRTIARLRTSKAAHPQMRELMIPLVREFKEKLPVFFEDIEFEE